MNSLPSSLMYWGYLVPRGVVILLSLIASGCASQPNNVVTAPDGVEIRFDQQGAGDPALVFVHGWANDRSIWEDQFTLFSDKYRVVNIDLPGFGRSGNDRRDFTIQAFGEDVATVVRELDLQPVVLVGFSMGSSVVIEAANRVPQRTVGVILVEGLRDVDARRPEDSIGGVVNFMMDIVTNPTNEKLVSNGFYKRNQERTFARLFAMLDVDSRTGWEESLVSAIRWRNEESANAISSVRVPIISINTDLRPTNVEAFRKYSPSYRARIIPDAGHVVMWDSPEEFNRLFEQTIQELISE